MKVIGRIVEMGETQKVTDTFTKRMFVLELTENPQYPEYITFELLDRRCDVLDGLQVGQNVLVNFDLKGKKWVDVEGVTKYFNALKAWNVESLT